MILPGNRVKIGKAPLDGRPLSAVYPILKTADNIFKKPGKRSLLAEGSLLIIPNPTTSNLFAQFLYINPVGVFIRYIYKIHTGR